MIRINIQVKHEGSSHGHNEWVEDNYIASKQNPEFMQLIYNVCKDSGFSKREGFSKYDKVKATVYFTEL
jgi:hypothetical protein